VPRIKSVRGSAEEQFSSQIKDDGPFALELNIKEQSKKIMYFKMNDSLINYFQCPWLE
jgi:hypothetical protein